MNYFRILIPFIFTIIQEIESGTLSNKLVKVALYKRSKTTWNTAAKICEENEGRLFIEDSIERSSVIRTVRTEFNNVDDLWIGLHYVGVKQNFSWTNCRILSNYNQWGTYNYIEFIDSKRCVMSTQNYSWVTGYCNNDEENKHHSLCEIYTEEDCTIDEEIPDQINDCYEVIELPESDLAGSSEEFYGNDPVTSCSEYTEETTTKSTTITTSSSSSSSSSSSTTTATATTVNSASDFTTPDATTPRQTAPTETTHRQTTPTATTSRQTAATTITPRQTAPTATTPRQTVPTTTMPRQTAPTTTAPRQTAPTATTPRQTAPTTTSPTTTTPTTTSPTTTTPTRSYSSTITSATSAAIEPNTSYVASSTPTSCQCVCEDLLRLVGNNAVDRNLANITTEEKLKMLVTKLRVNKTQLSSYVRKKTSARDNRVVSKSIGYLGVVFLAFMFGLLLLSDGATFLAYRLKMKETPSD